MFFKISSLIHLFLFFNRTDVTSLSRSHAHTRTHTHTHAQWERESSKEVKLGLTFLEFMRDSSFFREKWKMIKNQIKKSQRLEIENFLLETGLIQTFFIYPFFNTFLTGKTFKFSYWNTFSPFNFNYLQFLGNFQLSLVEAKYKKKLLFG